MNYSKWESLGLVYSLKQYSHDNELHHTHTQCPFYLKIDEEEVEPVERTGTGSAWRGFTKMRGSGPLKRKKILGRRPDDGRCLLPSLCLLGSAIFTFILHSLQYCNPSYLTTKTTGVSLERSPPLISQQHDIRRSS